MAGAKQELVNTFTKGMVMDLNPINTPDNVLTDCLNGTILTYDGNEYHLQSDKGNVKISDFPEKNVPVATTSYGDILYILSKNVVTDEIEIGSFPSPAETAEKTYDSIKIEKYITPFDLYDDWDIGKYTDLYTKLKPLLTSSHIINPGDKYQIITNDKDEKEKLDSKYFKHEWYITNDGKRTDITNQININSPNKCQVSWNAPGKLCLKFNFFNIKKVNIVQIPGNRGQSAIHVYTDDEINDWSIFKLKYKKDGEDKYIDLPEYCEKITTSTEVFYRFDNITIDDYNITYTFIEKFPNEYELWYDNIIVGVFKQERADLSNIEFDKIYKYKIKDDYTVSFELNCSGIEQEDLYKVGLRWSYCSYIEFYKAYKDKSAKEIYDGRENCFSFIGDLNLNNLSFNHLFNNEYEENVAVLLFEFQDKYYQDNVRYYFKPVIISKCMNDFYNEYDNFMDIDTWSWLQHCTDFEPEYTWGNNATLLGGNKASFVYFINNEISLDFFEKYDPKNHDDRIPTGFKSDEYWKNPDEIYIAGGIYYKDNLTVNWGTQKYLYNLLKINSSVSKLTYDVYSNDHIRQDVDTVYCLQNDISDWARMGNVDGIVFPIFSDEIHFNCFKKKKVVCSQLDGAKCIDDIDSIQNVYSDKNPLLFFQIHNADRPGNQVTIYAHNYKVNTQKVINSDIYKDFDNYKYQGTGEGNPPNQYWSNTLDDESKNVINKMSSNLVYAFTNSDPVVTTCLNLLDYNSKTDVKDVAFTTYLDTYFTENKISVCPIICYLNNSNTKCLGFMGNYFSYSDMIQPGNYKLSIGVIIRANDKFSYLPYNYWSQLGDKDDSRKSSSALYRKWQSDYSNQQIHEGFGKGPLKINDDETIYNVCGIIDKTLYDGLKEFCNNMFAILNKPNLVNGAFSKFELKDSNDPSYVKFNYTLDIGNCIFSDPNVHVALDDIFSSQHDFLWKKIINAPLSVNKTFKIETPNINYTWDEGTWPFVDSNDNFNTYDGHPFDSNNLEEFNNFDYWENNLNNLNEKILKQKENWNNSDLTNMLTNGNTGYFTWSTNNKYQNFINNIRVSRNNSDSYETIQNIRINPECVNKIWALCCDSKKIDKYYSMDLETDSVSGSASQQLCYAFNEANLRIKDMV